jgi:hypothetical protein
LGDGKTDKVSAEQQAWYDAANEGEGGIKGFVPHKQ